MYQTCIQAILGLSFVIIAVYCGLEVIPERGKLVCVNEKYFYNFTLNVKRYSRNSPYYYNVELTSKQTWPNNVSMHLIFNEYLHNEYHRSFIELHHRFCDMVKHDKFFGPMMVKIGLFCPLPVRTLPVINFTFSLDKFPNVFPFEKCRVDTELKITATNESMALMYHYVKIRNLS